jgi:hypothetical protein
MPRQPIAEAQAQSGSASGSPTSPDIQQELTMSLATAQARIDAQLRRSFRHLQENGTDAAAVDALEAFLRSPGTLERPSLIVRCRFNEGSVQHNIVVDNPKSHWRLTTQFLPFLERIRHRLHGCADVLVLLSDTMYVAKAHAQQCVEHFKRAPFLRADWNENDPISSHSLSIPDFTIQDASYGAEIEKLDEVASSTPFSGRKEVVKWRGRVTGPAYPDIDNCQNFPRYHLLKLAASAPTIVDARITHYDNFPDTIPGRALKQQLDELLGGQVPELEPWEFAHYKYLLSADGCVCTWKRVPNSLRTASVLLLQHSWNQFFYPGLVEWEHFVPIANDMSDLLEKYAWLRANPEQAEGIAREGRRFAEHVLSIPAIEDHFVAVFDACASLPRMVG